MAISRRVWAVIALMLAACGPTLPTASNPSCSWDNVPPSDADTVCRVAFTTVSDVTAAVVARNGAKLNILVPNRAVRRRLQRYGAWAHSHRMTGLHVVPSITLDSSFTDRIGVYFFVRGTSPQGTVKDDEVLFLRLHAGHGAVVGDQPNQQNQSPLVDHPDPPW